MSPLDRYIRREVIRIIAPRINHRYRTARARAIARTIGMCARCAANPAQPGMSSCAGCAETHRAYTAARRAAARQAVA